MHQNIVIFPFFQIIKKLRGFLFYIIIIIIIIISFSTLLL